MKRIIFILLIAICVLLNSAAFADEPKVLTVLDGQADVASIDPSKLEDTAAQQAALMIFGGLTTTNEETRELLPNLAESWELSDDGTVYTFHIQKGIPWVKYDLASDQVVKTDHEVTANDLYYAFMRTMNPETASPYGYQGAQSIKGAADYNNGTADASTVGVKVLDDYTLQIEFNYPAAYNISIASMCMHYAEPSWIIEEFGDKWTDIENLASFGPFTLKEWIHDDRMVFVKNPFFPGTGGVSPAKVDELVFLFRDNAAGMAEYEAGNVDWIEVSPADIERVQSDPILSAEFSSSDRACTEYYLLNCMAEFTDNVNFRKALSYSVNREDIVLYVTKSGETPAKMMLHPSLTAAPNEDELAGPTYDPEFARECLAKFLEEEGIKAEDVTITLAFNSNDKARSVAEAVQQMWKEELGINVNIEGMESKVYWATLDTPDMAQVARIGWCPDFFDSTEFIRDAFRSGNMNNEVDENGNPYGGVRWYNKEFDDLVDAAARETDNAKRVEMYTRAETIIGQEDVVFIPLYHYSYVALTKPYITRTFAVSGIQAYQNWDVNK